MSNYTQVLEFFMENNIQLNKEQIEEIKNICEAKDEQIYQVLKNPDAIKKFNKDLGKSIDVSGVFCRRQGSVLDSINKRIDKVTEYYHKGENDKAKELKNSIDNDIEKSGIKNMINDYIDNVNNKAIEEDNDRKNIKKIIKK